MTADLLLTLPELILSIGAIALMLVAAWGGERATGLISILSVALLVAAGFATTTAQGVAFGGLYRADAFAGFAKLLIYAATGVCIIIAPRFFAIEKLKPEYPVLILLATVGAGMINRGS